MMNVESVVSMMENNVQVAQDNEAEDKIKDLIYSAILKERLLAGKPVFEEFERQNIKYAVHKGAVLSKTIHGSLLTKKSGDTDLLISRGDIEKVKSIMKENGFVQGRVLEDSETREVRVEKFDRETLIYYTSQSHQLAPFIKETTNSICKFVNYDINTDIFWGESGVRCDMDSFLDNTIEIEIYGIKFRRLKPQAEFIAMCMHHYKDLNSIYLLWKCGINKSELEEIYLYIKKSTLDFNALFDLCGKYKVTDYIYYCISKARDVFMDEKLVEYAEKLKTEFGQKLLNCFGLCDSERKYWDVDFTALYNAEDIRQYMKPKLTGSDYKKIHTNIEMM